MKRLLIAAACGALLSLGCESQQPNNPAARTVNKPVTEEPRTTTGEPAPGGAPRPDERTMPPGGAGAANPQPGATTK